MKTEGTIKYSYSVGAIDYLRRARLRLNENTREALFYAALELRSGTESRLEEYLAVRKDVASRKKNGWQIIKAAKELDRAIRLGDKIVAVSFLRENSEAALACYYTPVTSRLRNAAGGRLHNLVHSMPFNRSDDDVWWNETRSFLESVYADLAIACKGTLLGPLLMSPDGKTTHMVISSNNEDVWQKVRPFASVGLLGKIRIEYLTSLPENATPFVNVL